MEKFLLKNNSDRLIIFLCGWGMDEKPLLPLKIDNDVLFLFNYSDLSLDFDFSDYGKIDLIAFSCGVFMVGMLKDVFPEIGRSAAINGTFKLFDNKFGLDDAVIKTFEGISLKNYMDFRKNHLLQSQWELEIFNANQPHRTIEDSMKELDALKTYYERSKRVIFPFDKIFVSKNDKIIKTQNQKAFWGDYSLIDGGHFPFYNFKTLDEIFEA